MAFRIRIIKKTYCQPTDGAQVQSPATLISGTAAPALAPSVNTAALFGCDIITVSGIAGFEKKPESRSGHIIVTKRHSSKRSKIHSETQQNFGMMPAYSESLPSSVSLPRTAHTPLTTKAQEELSEFEREYPW